MGRSQRLQSGIKRLTGHKCSDLSPYGDAYKECEYQKEAAYEPWNPPERRIIQVA